MVVGMHGENEVTRAAPSSASGKASNLLPASCCCCCLLLLLLLAAAACCCFLRVSQRKCEAQVGGGDLEVERRVAVGWEGGTSEGEGEGEGR